MCTQLLTCCDVQIHCMIRSATTVHNKAQLKFIAYIYHYVYSLPSGGFQQL